jgi:hypothetical protein
VRAQVEILDPRLAADDQATLGLRVTPLGGAGSSVGGEWQAQRLGPQSNFFEAGFVPRSPGSYSITVPELSLIAGENRGSVIIHVDKPALEFKDTDADPQMLARIAAATGGRVLELDQLEQGFREIRDRSVQIPDDIVEPLWDSRLVFALFVLMISLEWGLRKVFGLL